MTDKKHLSHAIGYIGQGKYDEAWEKLEKLNSRERANPEVLEIRARMYIQKQRWEQALVIAEQLIKNYPNRTQAYIDSALCLRKLNRVKDARNKLQAAKDQLKEKPTWFYHQACCECQLGNLDNAEEFLEQCFKLDESFRKNAMNDPDLQKMWKKI